MARPGGRTDTFYKNVAHVYNTHLRAGEPNPTSQIASDIGVSRNTVSGWLRRAREYEDIDLPDARKGKAG